MLISHAILAVGGMMLLIGSLWAYSLVHHLAHIGRELQRSGNNLAEIRRVTLNTHERLFIQGDSIVVEGAINTYP